MPSDRSPAERVLAARIAADSRWAHEPDREAATRPARDALDRRFIDEVDPNRLLSSSELAARVANARRAHFSRLALRSITARRAAARRLAEASAAERELDEASAE
jgi:hypothetical protein